MQYKYYTLLTLVLSDLLDLPPHGPSAAVLVTVCLLRLVEQQHFIQSRLNPEYAFRSPAQQWRQSCRKRKTRFVIGTTKVLAKPIYDRRKWQERELRDLIVPIISGMFHYSSFASVAFVLTQYGSLDLC